MKYVVGMGSAGHICIPSFINIGSAFKSCEGKHVQTAR
jgi:hypothetical protein